MTGVTPVGIITEKPLESRAFYARTLGIERVMTLRHIDEDEGMAGTVLRLESPQIELLSTELRILDRRINQAIRRDHRIILRPRDMGGLLNRLTTAGIEPESLPTGGLTFDDLNGISWEIKFDMQAWCSRKVA